MNILSYLLIFVIIILLVLIAYMSKYYNNVLHFYNNDIEHKIVEVTQKMFQIMGCDLPTAERFVSLNNEIINILNIGYSSILLYDGIDYDIKASNVEKEFQKILCDIPNDSAFKGNITKNISKYITVSRKQTLLYKSAIERKIRSALLIPLYYNNRYIGFWLIESKKENAYDEMSDEYIDVLRKNMAVFIDDAEFYNILELAKDKDDQTSFYNNIFLYSNTRKLIAKNEFSSLVLIGLIGLPEVNENYNRDIGNILLIRLANITSESLPSDSICVRYSGNRFIVIIPNSTAQSVQPNIERLLSKYKKVYEYVDDKPVNIDTQILIKTLKRQSNIEKEIQKLDKYMDGMKSRNTIKII